MHDDAARSALTPLARIGSSLVLYRLGRDRELGRVGRMLAGLLSLYQRAPVHVLADMGWGDFDLMMSSLLRSALLRLCRRRAGYWRQQPWEELPSSGWTGSICVLAVWIVLLVAVDRVFPILPAALRV